MTETETNLVTLTINGVPVEAEKGRLLIDVAEERNIFVPRFCYHPGMKPVAVCRMCLVKIEGQRKLMPACATPVDDGMNVDTLDSEAVDAQQGMLEFLLINHPLDCPICDRAGECPLQDQTYAHGPGSSRYVEPKRTYEKALEISDLVVLDRERCVLCWRCVRFCDEISGDSFIELVDRGPGTQILTFSEEPFDSYFSGNTIQICPVGALTAKPYRFLSRPWNLRSGPSVCAYCAVGCPITNESRSEKLVRCQALPNEQVNDFWICDKGRFGYHYVDSDDRLTGPLVREGGNFKPASWGDALAKAASLLEGKRVGVIAGGHITTEDAYAVGRLAKDVLKTADVDSRIQDAGAPYELALDFGGVAGSTATISDLDAGGTIVWIGPDPKETLPVLFLRLRVAVQDHDSDLVVISPRRLSLDTFAARSVRCSAGEEVAAIGEIAEGDLRGPVVVCWGPSSPGRDETEILAAALDLARRADARLLMCPPHAGSQGLIDMGVHPALDAGHKLVETPGRDTRAMLEAAAAGELDALLLIGADPIADFPDADLTERALKSNVTVIAVELFPTETVVLADVVFPAAAYAEREGTFTNLERRIQRLERSAPPPGTALEPWRVCAELARALGTDWGWSRFEDVWADIRKNVPTHKDVDIDALRQSIPTPSPVYESGFAPAGESLFEPHVNGNGARPVVAGPGAQYPKGYRSGAPFQTGQNWPLSWELRAFEALARPGVIPEPPAAEPTPPLSSDSPRSAGLKPDASAELAGGAPSSSPAGFLVYTGRMIYDEGAMVARTAVLRDLQAKPFVELNSADAERLGLPDGDEAVVRREGFDAKLPVRIGDIAEGAVFIPYDQQGFKANRLLTGTDARVEVARE